MSTEEYTPQRQMILRITNRHIPSCGTPPCFDDPHGYVSYFQNMCGEQAILYYNPDTETVLLYDGDAEWDPPYPVSRLRVTGDINTDLQENIGDVLKTPMVDGLILSLEARLWIFACLREWQFIAKVAKPQEIP